MKFLRWLLCFPLAMLASFIGWGIAGTIFSGVEFTYGVGVFDSIIGLLPLLITSAFPTIIFVVAGVFIAPSKERRVCFVFLGLSLLFSGGGINMLIYQDGFLEFWLASAAGIVIGGIIGLLLAMRIQRGRTSIQLPEPTSGLAPGRSSS
jgi:hypothetical protein